VHHEWEDLFRKSFLWNSPILTPIDEDVVPPRVAMDVTVHENSILLCQAAKEDLGLVDLWECFSQNCAVLSIQVLAQQAAPGIPHDHAVRIQHGNQFENKTIPKFLEARWIETWHRI
jgi:hypothetical protein